MYTKKYSLMEIKKSLQESERIPLNIRTKGHSMALHHIITDAKLRARAIDKGSSVSAFAKGLLCSDQFHSVAFLLNSPLGQEAMRILDILDSNTVETKKGREITRVAITGSVSVGQYPLGGARFAHNQGPLGAIELAKAEKMTVVLELKPKSFPAPLYIVTAFPQPNTKPDKLEPTLTQVLQWQDNTEKAIGKAISNLFR